MNLHSPKDPGAIIPLIPFGMSLGMALAIWLLNFWELSQ